MQKISQLWLQGSNYSLKNSNFFACLLLPKSEDHFVLHSNSLTFNKRSGCLKTSKIWQVPTTSRACSQKHEEEFFPIIISKTGLKFKKYIYSIKRKGQWIWNKLFKLHFACNLHPLSMSSRTAAPVRGDYCPALLSTGVASPQILGQLWASQNKKILSYWRVSKWGP